MDWSASSEIIETLDSCANDSSVADRRHNDSAFPSLPHAEEIDLIHLVDGIVSVICDAGEKLYASMLQWSHRKPDSQASSVPSGLCRSGVERQLEKEEPQSACGREIQLTQFDPSLENTPA